jgi:hypothetical protein
MTQEDKQLIAEYMGWNFEKPYIVDLRNVIRMFDLNDAALCVEKMVEKGDWKDFEADISYGYWVNSKCDCLCDAHDMYIAWLFNADNFFSALAEWLRVRK